MIAVRHGDLEFRFSGIAALAAACEQSEQRGGSYKPLEEFAEAVYDHHQAKFTKSRHYRLEVLNCRLILMRLGASYAPTDGELRLLESFA